MRVQLPEGIYTLGSLRRITKADKESRLEVLALELSDNRVLHISSYLPQNQYSLIGVIQDMLRSAGENSTTISLSDLHETISNLVEEYSIEEVHNKKLDADDKIPFNVMLEDSEGFFSVDTIAQYDSRIVLAGQNRSLSMDISLSTHLKDLDDRGVLPQSLGIREAISLVASLIILKRGGTLAPVNLKELQTELRTWGIDIKFLAGAVL